MGHHGPALDVLFLVAGSVWPCMARRLVAFLGPLGSSDTEHALELAARPGPWSFLGLGLGGGRAGERSALWKPMMTRKKALGSVLVV